MPASAYGSAAVSAACIVRLSSERVLTSLFNAFFSAVSFSISAFASANFSSAVGEASAAMLSVEASSAVGTVVVAFAPAVAADIPVSPYFILTPV